MARDLAGNVEGAKTIAEATTHVANAVIFTDATLIPGSSTIRAVHITELRTRIDAQRVRFLLAPFPWTDLTVVAGTTTVRAVHITELRSALAQAYAAAARTPPTYTDPSLGPGTTMRVVHITELRSAVMAIE